MRYLRGRMRGTRARGHGSCVSAGKLDKLVLFLYAFNIPIFNSVL